MRNRALRLLSKSKRSAEGVRTRLGPRLAKVFRTGQDLDLIDDFYLCDIGTRVLESHVANYLFQ